MLVSLERKVADKHHWITESPYQIIWRFPLLPICSSFHPPCGQSFLPTLVVFTLHPLTKAEIENDNPRGEGLICFAWSVSQQSPDRYPLTIPTTINAIVICDKSKSPERTKVASLQSTTCMEAIRRRLYSQSHEKALLDGKVLYSQMLGERDLNWRGRRGLNENVSSH